MTVNVFCIISLLMLENSQLAKVCFMAGIADLYFPISDFVIFIQVCVKQDTVIADAKYVAIGTRHLCRFPFHPLKYLSKSTKNV